MWKNVGFPVVYVFTQSPSYLYSCDDSLGTGNPCPNFSKIGVPKGVLIDIWG
jgi:hypothetical protein